MAYTDANTISNPTTGQPILAAWGDQIRTNQEYFIDPPGCSVYASSAQTVGTGTSGTDLTANSENFDNDSMHSTSTNTARITIQTAGRYLLTATVAFATSSTGNRRVGFKVNGSTDLGGFIGAGIASNSAVYTATRVAVLAAGDYVTTSVWQTSGGNLSVTLDEFAAMFMTR